MWLAWDASLYHHTLIGSGLRPHPFNSFSCPTFYLQGRLYFLNQLVYLFLRPQQVKFLSILLCFIKFHNKEWYRKLLKNNQRNISSSFRSKKVISFSFCGIICFFLNLFSLLTNVEPISTYPSQAPNPKCRSCYSISTDWYTAN